MAAYQKYTAAIEPMLEGMNVGTDTWKVALASTINLADTTFTAGTTDLATGNGYTAGGTATTIAVSETTGTTTVTIVDNDSAVAFTQPEYVVSETNGSVTISVHRWGGTNGLISAFYATANLAGSGAGFRIFGANSQDLLGTSVASAGALRQLRA